MLKFSSNVLATSVADTTQVADVAAVVVHAASLYQ